MKTKPSTKTAPEYEDILLADFQKICGKSYCFPEKQKSFFSEKHEKEGHARVTSTPVNNFLKMWKEWYEKTGILEYIENEYSVRLSEENLRIYKAAKEKKWNGKTYKVVGELIDPNGNPVNEKKIIGLISLEYPYSSCKMGFDD